MYSIGILIQDLEVIEREHPRALAFIEAAQIRKSCFVLALKLDRTKTEEDQLRWSIQAPACREPWFIELLANNGYEVPDE
jgi:hypothetical protein